MQIFNFLTVMKINNSCQIFITRTSLIQIFSAINSLPWIRSSQSKFCVNIFRFSVANCCKLIGF
jgi:hypothetical protein